MLRKKPRTPSVSGRAGMHDHYCEYCDRRWACRVSPCLLHEATPHEKCKAYASTLVATTLATKLDWQESCITSPPQKPLDTVGRVVYGSHTTTAASPHKGEEVR
jgi:hypothetical protein